MKLEVGQFVRTDKVGIKKIYKIDNNKTKYKYLYKLKNQDDDGCIDLGVLCEDDIIKFSYNIIDILEVGDYVNRYPVTAILSSNNKVYEIQVKRPNNRTGVWIERIRKNEDIKSIVTKEQFEQKVYRIGE